MIRQLVSTCTVAAALALSGAAYGQGGASASKEWDELVKAAQQEGQIEIILYGGMGLHKGGVQAFEKKYGIKVNYQTGSSRQHAERILAERRLGRYTVDAWIGGANTALAQLLPNGVLTPIDDLLVAPDVKDTSKWFQGKHHYTDPEARYIFTWGGSPDAQNLIYNTNMVKPDEIKSYWDLLDPKWKGKIVAMPPHAQGVGALSVPLYLMPEVGEEWFRRLANEMQMTVVEDSRQGAEWVALGRFPLGLFRMGEEATTLAKQGFPVQNWPNEMKEGEILTSGPANLMAVDKAPHPNAMKLFVNWALSKEGQDVFIKAAGRYDSLRNDADDSVLDPRYRIKEDGKYYIAFADPEYISRQKEILGKLQQIMREAGYR